MDTVSEGVAMRSRRCEAAAVERCDRVAAQRQRRSRQRRGAQPERAVDTVSRADPPAAGVGTGPSGDVQRVPLAGTAAGTSRENPWPVRRLTARMIDYIAKAPAVWVEGQVAQLSVRAGTAVVFLTLRDPSADVSLSVTCAKSAFAGLARPPVEGDRVVVHGRFEFYPARGSLNFKVDEVHPVGIGELLARLERLRRLLAAEGSRPPRSASGRCPSCPAWSGWSPAGTARRSPTSPRMLAPDGLRFGSGSRTWRCRARSRCLS